MELLNKVALVTGAGRGIGRAIALALAQAGARVAINGLDPASVDASAGLLATAGHESAALPTDVSDEAAVTPLVDAASSRWGRLDILVNNAGVEPHAPILDLALSDW
jgi:3-oxoacyl-[acyl-carrier protein] reductase